MDSNWAFCPACGTDNRAPKDQAHIAPHDHVFEASGAYCVKCGSYYYAGQDRRKKRLYWLAGSLLGTTVIGWAGAFVIYSARAQEGAPFSSWIRSWYSQPVSRESRYGGSYTVELGEEWVRWLFVAGLVALVLGLRALWAAFRSP